MIMFIFLTILFIIVGYIVGAGITHGYAKHRWPSEITRYGSMDDWDRRTWTTCLWPFYWVFIWTFTKANEITFSNIEKKAARQVVKNKSRIEILQATRSELEASNVELERAEVELEKEISKTL
jgi:hypothetical protein